MRFEVECNGVVAYASDIEATIRVRVDGKEVFALDAVPLYEPTETKNVRRVTSVQAAATATDEAGATQALLAADWTEEYEQPVREEQPP